MEIEWVELVVVVGGVLGKNYRMGQVDRCCFQSWVVGSR